MKMHEYDYRLRLHHLCHSLGLGGIVIVGVLKCGFPLYNLGPEIRQALIQVLHFVTHSFCLKLFCSSPGSVDMLYK